jgi:hypothetical protein
MTERVPRLPLGLDPLIAEAKRRATRRRLLIVAALALVLTGAALGTTLAFRAPSTAPAMYPAGVVPQGVQEINLVSAFPGERRQAASLHITDGRTVGRIVRLIDALKVVRTIPRTPSARQLVGRQ